MYQQLRVSACLTKSWRVGGRELEHRFYSEKQSFSFTQLYYFHDLEPDFKTALPWPVVMINSSRWSIDFLHLSTKVHKG